MNVLEKILEELEERGNIQFSSYTKPLIAVQDVLKIIRSHMGEMKNGGWIPVEDKLPEDDERYKGRKVIDVLVTTAKGKVTKVQRQSHNGYWWWGRIYGEPTAWQPLPEPYKKHRQ